MSPETLALWSSFEKHAGDCRNPLVPRLYSVVFKIHSSSRPHIPQRRYSRTLMILAHSYLGF